MKEQRKEETIRVEKINRKRGGREENEEWR